MGGWAFKSVLNAILNVLIVLVNAWLKSRGTGQMAYRLPTFNLVVNVWRNASPTTDPPDAIISGNLCPGRRRYTGDSNIVAGSTTDVPCMFLLCPSGSDIKGTVDFGAGDTVEVDAGSGRYYRVHYVDYVAFRFPNEHLMASILPSSGVTPPPLAGSLLLEDGTATLLEDGTDILLEA
jgi:hypothetical protein